MSCFHTHVPHAKSTSTRRGVSSRRHHPRSMPRLPHQRFQSYTWYAIGEGAFYSTFDAILNKSAASSFYTAVKQIMSEHHTPIPILFG